MATRQEITGTRELNFSQWVREELPDSATGFLATDLDFILYNYKTKQIALVEVKTRGANLKFWQEGIFKSLSRWVAKGIDSDWTFRGFYTIKFENTFFHDGKCYLNGVQSTEREIREILSLKKSALHPQNT